jgi:transposase InsO family protein
VINAKGIHASPEKVEAITKLEAPKNVTELRRFVGMINYLGRFTKNLSTIMKPLTDLLKKNIQWCWDSPQQKAFDVVKKIISELPSLSFYDPKRHTVVSADSSSYGLGATILQRDDNGHLQPIAFASRTLTPAEQRYSQIEKECLASVWACEKFYKYLVGLSSFELETDHRPLVPLMSTKDLDQAPVRCQRLLMRMARFNAVVRYVPGKDLLIADCLSRSPLPFNPGDVEAAEEVDAHVDMLRASWPISDRRLQSLRQATDADADLQRVIKFCEDGWPMQVPAELHPFAKLKPDLAVVDRLLTYQDRIVVPASQRPDVLQKLHESHQGLAKCLAFAKLTVFWPGLRSELTRLVENCQTCQEQKPAQRHEPLRPTELPQRPWAKLGADFAQHKGKHFLVVIDYYSRWIEIKHVKSLAARHVILRFKQIFSSHGIPDVVRSDNGPPFNSKEFASFAADYGFTHTTSSPHFPQANGEAESGVKIAKKLLRQSCPDVAIMNYRATPHSSTGVSPAQALYGRQLRTKVPVLPKRLQPVLQNDRDIRIADEKTKQDYKMYYDRRHGVCTLPPLQPNDAVRIKTDDTKKWQDCGTVLGPADTSGRSYFIDSPSGVLRRNRKHLQKVPEIPNAPPEPELNIPDDDGTNLTLPDQPQNPNPAPKNQMSRSGRTIKRPCQIH